MLIVNQIPSLGDDRIQESISVVRVNNFITAISDRIRNRPDLAQAQKDEFISMLDLEKISCLQ